MKKQGTNICFPLKPFYLSFGTIKVRKKKKKVAYKDHQLACCNQIRLNQTQKTDPHEFVANSKGMVP